MLLVLAHSDLSHSYIHCNYDLAFLQPLVYPPHIALHQSSWTTPVHFTPVLHPITTPRQPSFRRRTIRVDPYPLRPQSIIMPLSFEPQFSSKMTSMDLRVGGKYRIGKKIGSGSFGE